ncbi:NAD(P)/FAD-dependent oxidoreductase [Lacunimicrobium album]
MSQYDLLIIGAGPGGYVAAIRAAQLGLKVACVEKEKALGGTCLRVGCIPSKALLDSTELYEKATGSMKDRGIIAKSVELDLSKMLSHKDRVVTGLTMGVESLFKKNKVTRLIGAAHFTNPNTVVVEHDGKSEEVTAKNFLIATGSVPSSLPGIEPDGVNVVTSTEALAFTEVPKKLVVIGAGYIGLEMSTVWRRLGSEVVVLEFLDRILPGMDTEIATEAKKLFEKQGLVFNLGCKVTGTKMAGKQVEVMIEGKDSIKADKVLMSVGRKPATDQLGLDAAGVTLGQRNFITVNAHYQTNVPNIYAIGDVIGGAMLAHKAEEEGIACVEHIVTGYGHVNYNAIPAVVYTSPEIATVGKTEDQLKTEGVPYKTGYFPFMANGRAKAMGTTEGKIKFLAHAETDRVLGVHIIGPHAGDLIAEVVLAIEFSASSEDIARTCHAHPTLAEALKEAAMAVEKRAIHF